MTTNFFDSIIMLRFGKTEVAKEKMNYNLESWCWKYSYLLKWRIIPSVWLNIQIML